MTSVAHVGMKRQRDAALHNDFLRSLLSTMAESASMGGSASSSAAADSIKKVLASGDTTRHVLNSRFSLGADDGSYLRQNVMPVQSAIGDRDVELAMKLAPELESAGRAGVLAAFQDKLEKDRAHHRERLTDILYMVAWLLSIDEISEYVEAYLDQSTSEQKEEAMRLVNLCRNGHKYASTQFAQTDTRARDLARFAVLEALSILWVDPRKVYSSQFNAVFNSSTGQDRKLWEATEALGRAAAFSRKAYDANRVVPQQYGTEPEDAEPDTPTATAGSAASSTLTQFLGMTSAATAATAAGDAFAGNTEKPPDLDDSICTLLDPKDEMIPEIADDALCAAIGQLRGDGGVSVAQDGKLIRTNTVMPYVKLAFQRSLNRGTDTTADAWDALLWPSGRPSSIDVKSIPDRVKDWLDKSGNPDFVSAEALSTASRFSCYALARGLCGLRPPTQAVPDDAKKMRYNMPTVPFQSNILTTYSTLFPGETPFRKVNDEPTERLARRTFGPERPYESEKDLFVSKEFLSGEDEAPRSENATWARWAPVEIGFTNTSEPYWKRKVGDLEEIMAKCVVHEAIVDTFQRKKELFKQDDNDCFIDERGELLNLGALAFAKMAQLASLTAIMRLDKITRKKLCRAVIKQDNGNTTHFFVTRPVLICDGDRVLFPCDAGLSSYKLLKDPIDTSDVNTSIASTSNQIRKGFGSVMESQADQLAKDTSQLRFVEADGNGEYPQRRREAIVSLTQHLRAVLGQSTDPDATDFQMPLYVAPPETGPYLGGSTKEEADKARLAFDDFLATGPKLNPVKSKMFPPKLLDTEQIHFFLMKGVDIFHELEKLEHNEQHIKDLKAEEDARKNELCPPDDADELARLRREAVWNDAQREAAIAGDRLYSFVRQLSGTISENVDAVCQIDEGMLVRQQQQVHERRARMADRAAQEHMQLVRNVFTAVLGESGLALGIGEPDNMGKVGELKVVSNNLRKTLAQNSQQGSQEAGFFANAVRLEQLLTSGTGEMTLTDLFEKLRVSGIELQNSALAVPTATAAAGPSLDFLSTPRNSLLLRYKPEALAAMRQAFDLFQREMLAQHGRMYRTITAYELIEGNDETLCSAFAQFSAHMLVHSRMYSSATAIYVASWPAAANAQQLKVSLQRLVRIACQYLAFTEAPNFLSPEGRATYFARPGAPVGLAVAPPMMLRPRGLWSWNMTGNC